MSQLLIVVLRLIHIFAGVFWAGAGFSMVLFVEPTTIDMGPAGGQFMRQFTGPRKFSPMMGLAGLLSGFSGIYLYSIRSGGFRSVSWMSSGEGLFLAIGGLAGLVAMVIGVTIHRQLGLKMAELGRTAAASQGPPDGALLAEIGKVSEQVRMAGRVSSLLLVIALIGMAVAEYS